MYQVVMNVLLLKKKNRYNLESDPTAGKRRNAIMLIMLVLLNAFKKGF